MTKNLKNLISKSLWLSLSFSEIRNSRGFGILFILNLSLGLIGFLTLDSFKTSIHSHLQTRSKAILAADLGITTRRDITPEEEVLLGKHIPPGSKERRETGMFSMAVAPSSSRLVWVRAIDGQFPYYGELELEKGGSIGTASPKVITDKPVAWVYPELLIQLGVKVGDSLKIGQQDFIIDDVITKDPSVSTVSFVSAPKVYIGVNYVEQTGLVQTGSRVYFSRYYQLPPGFSSGDIEEALEKERSSSDLRVQSHENASPELGRILRYLNDYLGLVALVALFLAGVGAAYLFRGHLSKRVKDIAILLSLGVDGRIARRIYATQLVFLGLCATLLTSVFSITLMPILPKVFGVLLAEGTTVQVTLQSLALTGILGIGGSLLFCYPLLNRIRSLNPASLFQEDARPTISLSRTQLLGFLPILVVYWGLAVLQAKSLEIGSLFVGLFVGCSLLFSGVCLLILRVLERKSLTGSLAWRMASLNLARHKAASLACFLAIALGAMLVNIIPQIKSVLEEELSRPNGVKVPSLFLFDIQDEQVVGLQSLLKENSTELDFLSPMVQARLSKINGEAIKEEAEDAMESQEDDRRRRMRNRTYNLSYRSEFSSSENLVSGEPFKGSYVWEKDKPASMSLEVRFADRVGLEVGDTMEFDVGGVPVVGKVVNLRRVKWTSFQPNFFVQFQPGVLEDAPKTFVAAIPDADFDKKILLQNSIVKKFPNISIVDVSNTIERIMAVITQISKAITFMAILSLVAGLAVLFSIAGYQAQSRRRDTVLLKVLGLRFSTLQNINLIEFAILGFSAAGLGAFVSIGVSYVLAFMLFDSAWIYSLTIPAYTTAVIVLLCIGIGAFATRRSLRQKAVIAL
jgi:putative ABC transport system permease protein